MGYTNGTERLLYIYYQMAWLPIGCLLSNSFEETAETIDTTTRLTPNGWTTQRVTKQSYSIPFEGLVDNDKSGVITLDDLIRIKRSRETFQWRIGEGVGSSFGVGQLTGISEAAAVDEFISFSGNIVGFGEPDNEDANIYKQYLDRVTEAGGAIESVNCVNNYIERLRQ